MTTPPYTEPESKYSLYEAQLRAANLVVEPANHGRTFFIFAHHEVDNDNYIVTDSRGDWEANGYEYMTEYTWTELPA